MSPAILGMSYRWVTSISWTIRPCGNSRRIYWIAVKFPWLEFCLLLWMHHLFCTGLLPFVCSGVHDMEGKGGWASDCLTWWLDLTFLWRLFSGPRDKKKAQMCCCFTSSQQVNFPWCVQKIGLWSSDVLMFIPRSWPPRHGSRVVTAFFPGQILVSETIYHHEQCLEVRWCEGVMYCSTRRNLHDLGGYAMRVLSFRMNPYFLKDFISTFHFHLMLLLMLILGLQTCWCLIDNV